MAQPRRPYILVGVPGARRARLFCQALTRLGYQPPVQFTYTQAQQGSTWTNALTPHTVVRIESPGEDLATRSQWVGRPIEHGEIAQPQAQFEGFARSLERIESHINAHPHAKVMNRAQGILQMFDKDQTKRNFALAGVPSPTFLGLIESYDDLREKMRDAHTHRAFIKLRWSSSASGVVAYKTSGTREHAITSTVIVEGDDGPRLFNSLKLKQYVTHQDIKQLVDVLASHGAIAEAWEPKARLDGRNFDLRVVVINGQARHVVGRIGPSPMTNLHLGNARADLTRVHDLVGPERWARAMACAQQAASCFEGMTYSGADIMFEQRTLDPMAIEINAFGDLLPNVLDQGHDTYEAEILAVEQALEHE